MALGRRAVGHGHATYVAAIDPSATFPKQDRQAYVYQACNWLPSIDSAARLAKATGGNEQTIRSMLTLLVGSGALASKPK